MNINYGIVALDDGKNFKESAKKYRTTDVFENHLKNLKDKNQKFIAVIDNEGVNHYISRDEYTINKGIKFHHVNTKQAKLIRHKKRN